MNRADLADYLHSQDAGSVDGVLGAPTPHAVTSLHTQPMLSVQGSKCQLDGIEWAKREHSCEKTSTGQQLQLEIGELDPQSLQQDFQIAESRKGCH